MYLLKYHIPSRYNIHYFWSDQDERKLESKLTTVKRLNIMVDKLFDETAGRLINSHINTPFVIFINGIYHQNKYRNKIRSINGERETRKFLKEKYN